MDVKDRLVLTGVRVTNFLIYWNFFAIFLYKLQIGTLKPSM
jgi:hypothetical protein